MIIVLVVPSVYMIYYYTLCEKQLFVYRKQQQFFIATVAIISMSLEYKLLCML